MYSLFLSLPLLVLGVSRFALGQGSQSSVPNTFPHAWPGQPNGTFSPEWQSYFEVTQKLPNITAPLPRSFAGNIPVNRTGHPNDTLFFWAFENQGSNGSLTAPADTNNTDPWIIWLQGGPGSSGMIALTTENGPIHVLANGTWVFNNFSWNHLADVIWVDQPVGTGFSTADSTGYVPDEDQTGEDFLGFLSNLVKVFPSLATRPLFLTGESYAGTYIPYITKHLFQAPNPPVKLRKIAIGDGSLGSQATVEHLPVVNVIETYPALIGYDQDVFNYFREQEHLCGFDLNLTYPQNGHFPTLNLDYAVNFTFPWSNGGFDVYDIPDATNPEPFLNASAFFNDNRTRAALHAPTSKDWIRNFNYPFGNVHDRTKGNQYGDPSVEPIAFLSDLATNASAANVSIVFYSGNDDSLVQHRGTEVIIQNMTFGGVQGFSRKPSTPWFDDAGNFAGIVHQERGLTYVLVDGAGHLIPEWKPAQALVFLREFVLGDNLNGTVSGTVVVGGEDSTLANDFLPGGNVIFYGSSATQGTSTIPAATQAAWSSFIATATATHPPLANVNRECVQEQRTFEYWLKGRRSSGDFRRYGGLQFHRLTGGTSAATGQDWDSEYDALNPRLLYTCPENSGHAVRENGA
ncbi:alpha/beta-hydrolase [Trametes sanguinea]|nr:alpha/beta-hydrolase [Trametes sanguinea]